MERKLTTILAADVVGYSTLMENDEAGTFDRLRGHRKELFEPEIVKHHGRIFKLMGDGLLADFGSVVEAVECAVALQRGLAERNANVPDDQRIDLRIGINLGEVIVEGDDRLGEGVNIAARLQQLADPGGICVSAKVAKEVEKKLAFVFEPMGEQRVKNVAEPINVFKVKLDSVPLIKAPKQPLIPLGHRTFVAALAVAVPLVLIAGISAWQWFSPMDHSKPLPQTAAVDAKPTLVVLPFDNLSDSKEQGYLADGFTEDLVTELARAPGLFVISRNSAFSYKGKDVSPAKLAAELGVRYILEGSIRRAGDDVRINAQLIDSKTGGHLWAERFDASWSEVFSLQDKVIKNVVSALELRLVQGQQTTQVPGGTKLAAAYDAYLQGLELFFRDTPADLAKAVPALEKAVSLDPNYGQAYAVLASVYWRALGQWEDALGVTSREATKRTDLYLDEALKHPSARAYRLIADRLQYQQKIDEAITYLERAIPLDPSDASVYGKMAEVLLTDGRPAQAQGYLDATLRLDPVSAPYYANLAGETQFCTNQFEMAAKTLEKDVATNPDDPAPVILLVATYGHLGRTSDAPRLVQKLNSIAVRGHADMGTQLWARGFYPYKQPADAERLREGLRKAGVPELPFGYDSLSKNRLSGDDIRSKFFGHKTDGKDIDSAEECSYSWTTDGVASRSCGFFTDTKGLPLLEEGGICYWWTKLGRDCQVILRNPAGTFEQKNEFLMISPYMRAQFSVVD